MIILLPLLIIVITLSVDLFLLTSLINTNLFMYSLIISFFLGYYLDFIYYKNNPNDKLIDNDDLID
jgi:hypothetical protein